MELDRDPIDLFMAQWNRERPELDVSSLGVVSRVLMLEKFLEHSADLALARFGLSLWQFDVLAALRRSGPPFKLSPTQLMDLVTLTSGAMTNRIDRLEELKLVARESDPEDRRGVLIVLTPAGLQLANEAISARLEDARQNIASLSSDEANTLATLLRKVLISTRQRAGNRRARPRRVQATNGDGG